MAYTKVVLTRRKNCDHLSSRSHQRLHSMGQIEIEENRLYALSNREKTSREQGKFKLVGDAKGNNEIPANAAPGKVIWFHSYRFSRRYASHYLNAQASWVEGKQGKGPPVMWIRGETYPRKVDQVERALIAIEDR